MRGCSRAPAGEELTVVPRPGQMPEVLPVRGPMHIFRKGDGAPAQPLIDSTLVIQGARW